jgi:hypothetical protein
MAVLDRIATAQDNVFSARVAMILMKLSVAVLTEPGGTTNHANRLKLAQKHLRAEVNVKAVAAAVIASNPTIQSTIDGAPSELGSSVPDADIEFVLTGLYDGLANAYAA